MVLLFQDGEKKDGEEGGENAEADGEKGKKKRRKGEDDDESVDYKAGQKFAKVMSGKTEAVSEFAKRNTMKQQRQYLPIFAVRQEVCRFACHVYYLAKC